MEDYNTAFQSLQHCIGRKKFCDSPPEQSGRIYRGRPHISASYATEINDVVAQWPTRRTVERKVASSSHLEGTDFCIPPYPPPGACLGARETCGLFEQHRYFGALRALAGDDSRRA